MDFGVFGQILYEIEHGMVDALLGSLAVNAEDAEAAEDFIGFYCFRSYLNLLFFRALCASAPSALKASYLEVDSR